MEKYKEKAVIKSSMSKSIKKYIKKGLIQTTYLYTNEYLNPLLNKWINDYINEDGTFLTSHISLNDTELELYFLESAQNISNKYNEVYTLKAELKGNITKDQIHLYNKLNKIIDNTFTELTAFEISELFTKTTLAQEINELRMLVENTESLLRIFNRPTEKQIKYLNKLEFAISGISDKYTIDNITRTEVQKLIDDITENYYME